VREKQVGEHKEEEQTRVRELESQVQSLKGELEETYERSVMWRENSKAEEVRDLEKKVDSLKVALEEMKASSDRWEETVRKMNEVRKSCYTWRDNSGRKRR
jgi:uncharacterized protein with PhoU and TrkA domain